MADKSATHDTSATNEHGDSISQKKKLSPEEVATLSKRLCDDTMARKAKKLEEMEAKLYMTEEPKRLDRAAIEASATRQVNDEMDRRKRRNEELKAKFYKEAAPKTMTSSEVEDSVRRIYADAMKQKKDKLDKLDSKHAPKGAQHKPIDDATRIASADRLSKPKKTAFTTEEINKIYGF